MSSSHAVFHPLTIAAIEPLTDDSAAITFDVPDELREDYAFTQGQHITVLTELAGDQVRRNYSICTPVSSGTLRIAVKRLPGGAFSEHALDQLRPGDVIDVMTPSGRFFTELDPENAKSYVCVAAGSGITPVLSIVATTLEVEPQSRVTLIYANRTHASVMFLEEVELFSGRLDVPRMQRFLDALVRPEDVDEWFLCGPYEMVASLRKQLIAEGVSKRAIHAEVFHVETTPPARRTPTQTSGETTGAEVTITLDGRRSSFTLAPEGPSVLEAALAVRPDAPFACKGGVCGTCRAKVVEGTVEMDTNWALEPDEVERGYALTCQSHPTSPKVVLDYDA
ncbi:MAG: 2Fe-2S iron-sulfur cluster-binding protein [Nocardioidaceae bacterium]